MKQANNRYSIYYRAMFALNLLAVPIVHAQSALEQRVLRLEQIQQNQQQFNNVNQMILLQESMEQLRGEVEVLNKSLQELTNRQQLLYQDIDQRLQTLEKGGKSAALTPLNSLPSVNNSSASATTPSLNSITASPVGNLASTSSGSAGSGLSAQTFTHNTSGTNPASASVGTLTSTTSHHTASTAPPLAGNASASDAMQEQALYQQAYQNLLDKNYDQALSGLNTYLQNYPQGRYRANAYYWQGEIYLIKNDPQQARQAFNTVVKDFADNPKAGDALLKLGYSYAALGDKEQAKTIFNQVITQYPNTAIANLAETRLAELS